MHLIFRKRNRNSSNAKCKIEDYTLLDPGAVDFDIILTGVIFEVKRSRLAPTGYLFM